MAIVSELVTNSVRHATLPNGRPLWLRAAQENGMLYVAVHDDGTAGTVAERPAETSGDHIGGYGLQLVAALASAWGVERDVAGTLVWAQLPY